MHTLTDSVERKPSPGSVTDSAARAPADAVRWCRWLSVALGAGVAVGLYEHRGGALVVHHFHAANTGLRQLPAHHLKSVAARNKPALGTCAVGDRRFDFLAMPVADRSGKRWTVGCAFPTGNDAVRRAAARMIHLAAAWLDDTTNVKTFEGSALVEQLDRAESVVHAAQTLVDALAASVSGPVQVSYLSSARGGQVSLRAVSGRPCPAQSNPWVASLKRVAREFRAQQHKTLGMLDSDPGTPCDNFILDQHDRHREHHDCKRVLSFGVMPSSGEQCAIVIAEVPCHAPAFRCDFANWIGQLRSVAAVLAWHERQDQSVLSIAAERLKPRRLMAQLSRRKRRAVAAALMLIVLCLSATVSVPYHVTAEAEVIGQSRRMFSAPREGFISTVAVSPGDVVAEGDVLVTLNTDDLEVKRGKWLAEIAKINAVYHGAMASGDRREINIQRARRAELEAELAFTETEIARSTLVSDRQSVVTYSALDQRIGTVVSLGEPLLETAQLKDYRVQLRVIDDDIALVDGHSPGALVLAAKPDQEFQIAVSHIAPKATIHEQSNVFVVEANVVGLPADILPGMTGFARLNVGSMSLLSAWTRKARESLWLLAWRLGFV